MFTAVKSRYLAPFNGSFTVASLSTVPPNSSHESKDYKKKLEKNIDELRDLPRILHAHDRGAILLTFQAVDAAGEDLTI